MSAKSPSRSWRDRLAALGARLPAPWLLALLAGLLVSSLARAHRPGGGGSFSGGSSSSGGGSSGGGDDDDAILECIWFLLQLCIDHPKIGVPLLLTLCVYALVTKGAQSDWTKTIVFLVGVAALGGLFAWSAKVGFAAVGGVIVLTFGFALTRRRKPADWATAPPSPEAAAARAISTGARPRRALEELRTVDPEFSLVVLEDFLYGLYAHVMHARGAQQLDRWAPYLGVQPRDQLQDATLVEVGDVIIGAMRFGDAGQLADRAFASVEIESNLTERRGAGEPHGVYRCERWRIERKASARSRPPDKARVFGCPSCGAALDGIQNSTCSYCKQVVDNGEHDWVVTHVEVITSETRAPILGSDAAERGTDLPTLVDDDLRERLAALTTRDPSFSQPALTARIRLIFDTMQAAWSSREWLQARPYLSDNLWEMQRYWIEAYKKAHLRNALDGARIERVQLARVMSDKHFDGITVRVSARGKDYTVDEAGKVVSGSPTKDRAYTEYWTLIRGAAATGTARSDAKCPNCGAELHINMAGACEYCRAKVTMGQFDWVLSRIEQDEAYAG